MRTIWNPSVGKKHYDAMRGLSRDFSESTLTSHQFLGPVINSYVESRLAEGASIATVRLEIFAVRGLFQFALDMGLPI